MSKPSIGDATIPILDNAEKKVVKELTVLEPDSKESIFSLIFSDSNAKDK